MSNNVRYTLVDNAETYSINNTNTNSPNTNNSLYPALSSQPAAVPLSRPPQQQQQQQQQQQMYQPVMYQPVMYQPAYQPVMRTSYVQAEGGVTAVNPSSGVSHAPQVGEGLAAPLQSLPGVPVAQLAPVAVVPTDFQRELFACSDDCGTCCLATFCPCVVMGQIAELRDGTSRNTKCFESASVFGLFNIALSAPCVWWGYAACNRSETRRKLGIQSDLLCDYMAHCFCQPCALTQEKLELQAAFQAPPRQQMNMPPPVPPTINAQPNLHAPGVYDYRVAQQQQQQQQQQYPQQQQQGYTYVQ